VKRINACAAFISLVLGVAVVTPSQAEDYYIYHDRDGKLFISNQEPPPGSKITKRISFPDATDNEAPQNPQSNNPQPNGQTEAPPKPFKGK
jgi:hypothetical protein